MTVSYMEPLKSLMARGTSQLHSPDAWDEPDPLEGSSPYQAGPPSSPVGGGRRGWRTLGPAPITAAARKRQLHRGSRRDLSHTPQTGCAGAGGRGVRPALGHQLVSTARDDIRARHNHRIPAITGAQQVSSGSRRRESSPCRQQRTRWRGPSFVDSSRTLRSCGHRFHRIGRHR